MINILCQEKITKTDVYQYKVLHGVERSIELCFVNGKLNSVSEKAEADISVRSIWFVRAAIIEKIEELEARYTNGGS